MRFVYYFFWLLVYLPFKIMYPVKIIGKKNRRQKLPMVYVSNHLLWADAFIVALCLPGYKRAIAKKEIGKNWFVRFLAKSAGLILIDRQNVDISSTRACINALKKGQSLLMFPEGTRNKVDESLQEVKQGAAMMAIKGGAELVPVIIESKPRLFRRTYIYIGEKFSLSEFSFGRLDKEKLSNAAAFVSKKMEEAKNYISEYVKFKKSKKGPIRENEMIKEDISNGEVHQAGDISAKNISAAKTFPEEISAHDTSEEDVSVQDTSEKDVSVLNISEKDIPAEDEENKGEENPDS